MLRALAHRNYRLWAAADLVSVTGSWMQILALNWLVLSRTGSATSVGLAILLQAVPALLFGSWAGALADRLPPRRVLLCTQAMHGVLAAGLALLAADDGPLMAVYAISVLTGLLGVFEGPALGRFAARIVSREDLGNAMALGSICNSTGRVLGMSLAGVLAAVVGVPLLFVLNAISFLAVIAAVLAVRMDLLHPLATSTSARSGVRAGLRYLRADRSLLTLFALGFVLSSFGRNYQVTMAAMADGVLHRGAAGYGALSTVFAVGTVIGGVISARCSRLTPRLLVVTALATGLLQALSGLAPSLWSFALVMVPIAMGAVVIDTTLGTRAQLDTAEDMRGRVIAAQSMVGAAAGAVGGPALGWFCERIGAPATLGMAGSVVVAAALLTAAALTKLRRDRAVPLPEPALVGQLAPDVDDYSRLGAGARSGG
ncbi:MFS transporter [Actinosynnema sp. ALI-1.44]|nr:MFS transporter [Actinosynnema sp. ALI-1.44]